MRSCAGRSWQQHNPCMYEGFPLWRIVWQCYTHSFHLEKIEYSVMTRLSTNYLWSTLNLRRVQFLAFLGLSPCLLPLHLVLSQALQYLNFTKLVIMLGAFGQDPKWRGSNSLCFIVSTAPQPLISCFFPTTLPSAVYLICHCLKTATLIKRLTA